VGERESSVPVAKNPWAGHPRLSVKKRGKKEGKRGRGGKRRGLTGWQKRWAVSKIHGSSLSFNQREKKKGEKKKKKKGKKRENPFNGEPPCFVRT